jgi:hypothetical protein
LKHLFSENVTAGIVAVIPCESARAREPRGKTKGKKQSSAWGQWKEQKEGVGVGVAACVWGLAVPSPFPIATSHHGVTTPRRPPSPSFSTRPAGIRRVRKGGEAAALLCSALLAHVALLYPPQPICSLHHHPTLPRPTSTPFRTFFLQAIFKKKPRPRIGRPPAPAPPCLVPPVWYE